MQQVVGRLLDHTLHRDQTLATAQARGHLTVLRQQIRSKAETRLELLASGSRVIKAAQKVAWNKRIAVIVCARRRCRPPRSDPYGVQ
jgi:hypothetical protein